MNSPTRIVAGLVGLATVGALSAGFISSNASATGTPTDTRPVGSHTQAGEWLVQLKFGDARSTFTCSGSAISPEWVLTSKHCIDGARWMNAYYSASTTNRGPAQQTDRLVASPTGDIALVHLSRPRPVSTYPTLADDYAPKGGRGTVAGFGQRADKQRASGLFSVDVKILGVAQDEYAGDAVRVRGIDGASNHNDSGGPLLVDGALVGVCSTGDTADPDTHAGAGYANISGARSWIRSTAGV